MPGDMELSFLSDISACVCIEWFWRKQEPLPESSFLNISACVCIGWFQSKQDSGTCSCFVTSLWDFIFFKEKKKAKLFQCTYQGSNISTRLSPCLVNTDTGFSRSRNWRLLRNETPARREPQPVIFILVIDSAPPYAEVTLCNSHNDKIQWLTKQDPHRDLFTLDLFWWWQCNVRNSLPLHCHLHPDITVMDMTGY